MPKCDHEFIVVKVNNNDNTIVKECNKCRVCFIERKPIDQYEDVHHLFFTDMMHAIKNYFKDDNN